MLCHNASQAWTFIQAFGVMEPHTAMMAEVMLLGWCVSVRVKAANKLKGQSLLGSFLGGCQKRRQICQQQQKNTQNWNTGWTQTFFLMNYHLSPWTGLEHSRRTIQGLYWGRGRLRFYSATWKSLKWGLLCCCWCVCVLSFNTTGCQRLLVFIHDKLWVYF